MKTTIKFLIVLYIQLHASCFASNEAYEQLANINVNDVQSFIEQCHSEYGLINIKEIKIRQNDTKIFLISKNNEELIVKIKINKNSYGKEYRYAVSELKIAKNVLDIVKNNNEINIPVIVPYKYGFFDKKNNTFIEVNDIQNFDISKFDYYKQKEKQELICFQLMKKAKGTFLDEQNSGWWNTPEFGYFIAEYGKSLGILHKFNIPHGDTKNENNIFYDNKEINFIDISEDPKDPYGNMSRKKCYDIKSAEDTIDKLSLLEYIPTNIRKHFNDYIIYLNKLGTHKKLFIEMYEKFSENNIINFCNFDKIALSHSINKYISYSHEDTECNSIMVLSDDIKDKSMNSDEILDQIYDIMNTYYISNIYKSYRQYENDICFIVKIGEKQYEIYRYFHDTHEAECIVKHNSDDDKSIKKLLEELSQIKQPLKQSECKAENIPGLWQTIKSLHGYTDESIITIEKKKQLAKTYKKIVKTLTPKLYSKDEVQKEIKILNDTLNDENIRQSKSMVQFDFCTQILACSEYSDEEISQLIKENSDIIYNSQISCLDWILYI